MFSRRNRGLTAVELLIVIIVVGIAGAVTVPALLRAGRNDRMSRCESNLRALWQADADLRTKGGALPASRGGAYWEAIAPPELRICPLSGQTRYRGPITDPGTLPPGSLIGADAPGSHGKGEGGNVLFKTGEIRATRELDGLWRYAAEHLAP